MEGAIHEALYQLEWIPPLHYEQPTDLHYNRCSRTDKGVHALFNVVSMKFRLPTSNLQEGRRMLNEKLPEDIRILGKQQHTNHLRTRVHQRNIPL